jgi:hypothetical protein
MAFQSEFTRQQMLPASSAADYLRNLGIVTTGNVFFVDSVTGSNAYTGRSPSQPVATINYAVSLCTASNSDVIICLPTHVETITTAGGIDISKAGITVIGVGVGSNRPTISIGTITTATFKVSAANTRIANMRFKAVTAQLLVKMIDAAADDLTMEDCWFQAASTATFLVSSFISITTTKDNFKFVRCEFYQGTDPAGSDGGADTGGIYMVDTENVLVDDCQFYGNFETAIIHNKTTAAKNVWVRNCRGIQALSGAEPFQLVDGCNGAMLGGGFITPAEAATTEATLVGTVGNSFFVLQPGSFGNDSGAGGSGGIVITAAS